MFNSLWSHGLQHTKLLCPPTSPRVCSNSCPLSRWCYLTISSSVTLFSFCFQCFPASGSFPRSWLLHQVAKLPGFQLQHQSFQWILRIDWFDLLAVQGTLKNLIQHHNSKASVLWCSVSFMVQLSYPYMTIGKTIALTIQTFVSKVIFLFLNMLCRFIIAFLPRSRRLWISQLQSPSTVILEPKKTQFCF